MLSDMDYKEKYEMALERARDYKNNIVHEELTVGESIMDYIFPELKESEDERIKKEIIDVIQHTFSETSRGKKKWIAWLEKQGKSSDQIHYWTEEEIEPIISDYLRGAEHYGGMIARLRCLKPKSLEKQSDSPIKWNKNTKDCKPKVSHSVLMKTTHGIAEGEWQGEQWHQYRWAGLVRDTDVLSWIELSDLEKQGEQKPTIEMKSAEESLGIDSETYNKIVDECIYGEQKSQRMISAEAKEAMYDKPSDKIEQKSAWTKEDDVRLQVCIDALQAKSLMGKVDTVMTNWLKSLKQRVGG